MYCMSSYVEVCTCKLTPLQSTPLGTDMSQPCMTPWRWVFCIQYYSTKGQFTFGACFTLKYLLMSQKGRHTFVRFYFTCVFLPNFQVNYCKRPKISDTRKFAVISLKVQQDGFSLEQCIQKIQRELQTV